MTDEYVALTPQQRVELAHQHLQQSESIVFQQRMNLRKFERQLAGASSDEDTATFEAEIARLTRTLHVAQLDVDTMKEILAEAAADLPPDSEQTQQGRRARRSTRATS